MSDQTSKNFTRNLKALKALKELTFNDIEKGTGIPDSTIHYHVQNNCESIPLKMAAKIADYFGKSLDWFSHEHDYNE